MDTIHTIFAEGSLVGTRATPFIRELETLVSLDHRLVVVDVRRVDFLTKDAVRTLRRTAATLEARDDALVVLAPNEMVRGLLKLHDPGGDIPVFDTREDLERVLQMHLPMHSANLAPSVPTEPCNEPEREWFETPEDAPSSPGSTPPDVEEAAFTPSPPTRSRVLERLLQAAAAGRSSAPPDPDLDPDPDQDQDQDQDLDLDPDDGRLSHAELDALTGDWPPPEHEHAVPVAPELDEDQLAQAEEEAAEGEFDEVGISGALDQLVGEGVFGSTSPDSGLRLVEPECPSDPPVAPEAPGLEDVDEDEDGRLSLEVQGLLERLIDEHATQTERWKVVRRLGRSGDPSAVPFLQELIQDPEPTIREMAAVSLRRLGAQPSCL